MKIWLLSFRKHRTFDFRMRAVLRPKTKKIEGGSIHPRTSTNKELAIAVGIYPDLRAGNTPMKYSD